MSGPSWDLRDPDLSVLAWLVHRGPTWRPSCTAVDALIALGLAVERDRSLVEATARGRRVYAESVASRRGSSVEDPGAGSRRDG